MWIVNLALRRPYTFIVLAIFILIAGVLSILRTPKDIFPSINIPVISVIFNFAGLSPKDMDEHLTTVYERVLTTTVDNIEHIESESLFGIAVVKIFLQPTASVPRGIAQVTSVSQAILRQLPSGTTPPLVLSYSATDVPVLRVGLSGLAEQTLNDLGLNFVRPQFITVPGVSVPYPYGGKQKFVEIDLNYRALQGYGLTPSDVVNTITAQNLVLPSGTEKIGRFEYLVWLNSSPTTIEKLNAIPIKSLPNGTTVYIRDVANVVNGSIPQTNIVRFNGQRATMLDIQKTGNASTLDIVKGIKDIIPDLKQTLPPALNISLLSDQSIFVTGAIEGVVREAVIAGCLTAMMILLFLGDWKSTLIIAISIPLAILSSIAVLSAIGETLNIMTLGGLALAVGILVDDATVTIENIDRHLAEGKPTLEAIRDGAAQIAVPALVSTMCICIVFVPIFFLSGVAKYLFSPLAEAVIFAMIASYILSRTLIPTLAMYWIKKHHRPSEEGKARKMFPLLAWLSRFPSWFESRFDKFREGYRDLLSFGLRNAGKLVAIVLGFTVLTMVLFPSLGQDFFPSVDAGAFDMHVRMKAGTRIEETARSVDQIEQMIRQIIPANQLQGIVDNLGIPYSGINTSYNNTGTMSAADGDILVSLNPNHDPTNKFVETIRVRMQHDFIGIGVWFPPADMVAQILNFGLPAPIDVQIIGADQEANFQFANNLMNQIRKIPGAVDFRIQEPNNAPELDITMDRTKASILGINAQAVANTVLGALAGSQQNALNFWVDPTNGVSYQVNAQVPQSDMNSLDALRNLPILLAEIDTPEVDAELAQAQAQLKVAQATCDLSKVTYQRFQVLFQRNVIAAQDYDTAADNYGQNRATVVADQANVNRLAALEAFKIVRAPFDGIVTARDTDIGAFIPLGSGMQIFRMAWISPLRVYVDVPEPFAEFVKVGAETDLTVGQVPGRKYAAQVIGTARAINPMAKRLLIELEVPNQTGQLFPGAYVQVTLKIEGDKGDLTIPAGALLFTSGKPAVGVVRPNGTVEIRKIEIHRDLGSELEISHGLSESDQIVASPAPGLVDGTEVIVAKPT